MTHTFEHTNFKSGSCLQGHMKATYDELVECFGEATYKGERDGGFDKVWTEWTLDFTHAETGETIHATIYDWKCDRHTDSRTGVYNWHIGGYGFEAECVVGDVFEAYCKGLKAVEATVH